MRFSSQTNIGLVRKHNEDSFCINEAISLLAVADGMGGHNAGEVASSMAVKTIENSLLEAKEQLQKEPLKALEHAIKEANSKIHIAAGSHKDQKGMGTTIVAAVIDGKKLYLAHVGDSRAYLIHRKTIKQLTQDHSLVNELIKNGGITEKEALNHPQKNVITRALGTSPDVTIDLFEIKLFKDDILLLCSDGMSNLVSPEEMKEEALNYDLEETTSHLVDKAIAAGGFDNITVVLCQI